MGHTCRVEENSAREKIVYQATPGNLPFFSKKVGASALFKLAYAGEQKEHHEFIPLVYFRAFFVVERKNTLFFHRVFCGVDRLATA